MFQKLQILKQIIPQMKRRDLDYTQERKIGRQQSTQWQAVILKVQL